MEGTQPGLMGLTLFAGKGVPWCARNFPGGFPGYAERGVAPFLRGEIVILGPGAVFMSVPYSR